MWVTTGYRVTTERAVDEDSQGKAMVCWLLAGSGRQEQTGSSSAEREWVLIVGPHNFVTRCSGGQDS